MSLKPLRLLLGLLALLPLSVEAQQTVKVAQNVEVISWIPAPSMLAGTPTDWRDSLRSIWQAHLPTGLAAISPTPSPGSLAEIRLQLRRDGRVHRARLARPTGNGPLDSLLLANAWEIDRSGGFPPMPHTVAGAGVEVPLNVYIPVPEQRTPWRPVEPIALSAACDSALQLPNTWVKGALTAHVDSTSGDASAAGWGARTLAGLSEAYREPGRAYSLRRASTFMGEVAGMDLGGSLRFQIGPTGKVLDAQQLGSTGYEVIDSALIGMAWRADSLGIIPPPPIAPGDTAILELTFHFGRGGRAGVPLGNLEVGTWSIETPPNIRRIGRPRYPEQLRSANISGRVVMEFTIDTDGVPVPASFTIISTPHPGFAASALRMVQESRYTPAKIRGCSVPTMVRQAVNFNAGGRPLRSRDVMTTRPIN